MKIISSKNKFLSIFLCIALISTFLPIMSVDADISPNFEIPITYISSVDNLQYPATNQFVTITGVSGGGKVVINEPTVVKAYMNWDSTKVNSPTIWFSRDTRGIDLVGTQTLLTSAKNYQLILLDIGTYYFNYNLKSNTGSTNNYIYTTVGVCIVGQVANSTESIYDSSKNYPNTIEFNKVETGFLSITAPIDYYRFELKEKSIINISFNFLELKDINLNGSTCTLKNSMDANIIEKKYNSQGSEYNTITKILEPGIYYINMKGSTTVTSLEVKKVPYVIKSSKSSSAYTKGNVKVNLNIPFEFNEILVTKGNIPKSKITDYNTWSTYRSENTMVLTSKTYIVTTNGTYTFRINDYLGNYTLHTVTVTNIDKTAPTVSGVTNGKTYKDGKIITFSDKLSGMKSAKLNNKSIKSGTKVTAKGVYTLVVTDKVGNTKTVKFKIK
jgi:hypothetical protein